MKLSLYQFFTLWERLQVKEKKQLMIESLTHTYTKELSVIISVFDMRNSQMALKTTRNNLNEDEI